MRRDDCLILQKVGAKSAGIGQARENEAKQMPAN